MDKRAPGIVGEWMVVVSILLSGCSNEPTGGKQAEGEMVGSILGSTIGNFIPGGASIAGQVVRSHGGTIGSMIGGTIGAALDEEDRRRLEAAMRTALASGTPSSFENPDSGVKATVTPAPIINAADGKQCRSVKQDVVLKGGKVLSETVKACKDNSGKWEV